MTERTIPLLPCAAIDPTVEFYQALGFEVTYQQTRPNPYAVVCRGAIELHFFTMRGYDPAGSYSTCYVRVPAVDDLYQACVAGLRAHYGRVPAVGIPRVIPLRDKAGRREFILVDPGGNWIRIGQPTDAGADAAAAGAGKLSKLARAFEAAVLLADSKGDDRAAAALLDTALERSPAAAPVERARALALRARLALSRGDRPGAQGLLAALRALALDAAERALLRDDLAQVDELELLLQAEQ